VETGNDTSTGGGYRCDGPCLASAGTRSHIEDTRKDGWAQALLGRLGSGMAVAEPIVRARARNRCLVLGKFVANHLSDSKRPETLGFHRWLCMGGIPNPSKGSQ